MSTDHPTRRDVCWGRIQTITESLIQLAFIFGVNLKCNEILHSNTALYTLKL